MDSANSLKQSAKDYITQLYHAHRNDDIEAWENLVDVLFLYIDAVLDEHVKDYHKEQELHLNIKKEGC